ncbi:MAG: aminotransferase class I/II-fold pyridoxal phosphate-dependent enzyme, partial [Alcaligenes sp.]
MSSAAPEYAFATPFLNPPASPIRSLMPYALRPGTISLAGGYPAQELFDVEGLSIASTQVMSRLGACLQYSNIDGQTSLRNELARLTAARGLQCNADTELVVTGGSQQALALLTRVMLQPGDHAIIESPAFPNSVQALRYTGATVHTVASGPDGIDVDALDELAARVKPKMVCVVASFSNPCGATISRQRRLRLLELAVKHRFLIVEDDPYSELRFAGEAVPP